MIVSFYNSIDLIEHKLFSEFLFVPLNLPPLLGLGCPSTFQPVSPFGEVYESVL